MSGRRLVVLAAGTAVAALLAACADRMPDAARGPLSGHVVGRIDVPGAVRWDYVTVEPATHRLYIAHATQVDVVDLATSAPVVRLDGTNGVHGAVAVPALGRVFTSDGADGSVGVFDAATGQRLQRVPAGANPDAIAYEPVTRRIVALNGRSQDATLIDAATGQVVFASLPLGGKPEYAVADGHGRVFVNIEDTHELVTIDVSAGRVAGRYSIAPCEAPTGLDRDPQGRLWSVCRNETLVVSDPATGRVVGQSPIGHGVDGVAWLDGRAYASNGRDGTVSVVEETAPGRFETVATLVSEVGARTIAADPVGHRLYLPTADYAPAPPPAEGASAPRPVARPGSFHVLVMTPFTPSR